MVLVEFIQMSITMTFNELWEQKLFFLPQFLDAIWLLFDKHYSGISIENYLPLENTISNWLDFIRE